jgi:hypothetical protein
MCSLPQKHTVWDKAFLSASVCLTWAAKNIMSKEKSLSEVNAMHLLMTDYKRGSSISKADVSIIIVLKHAPWVIYQRF